MTNGIISIVNEQGNTLVKCVAGSDGYNAKNTADAIAQRNTLNLMEIFQICIDNNFGGEVNLVVQNEDSFYTEIEDSDELPPLYQEKFTDSNFNPRWHYGTAEHVEIVVHKEN